MNIYKNYRLLNNNYVSSNIQSLTYYSINKKGNGIGSRLRTKMTYLFVYADKKIYRIYGSNDKYDLRDFNITKNQILKYIDNYKKNNLRAKGIIGVYFNGKRINNNSDYLISNKIIEEVKKKYDKKCVYCGSKENICIDHKDDLYEYKEPLNINTQNPQHFQILCNHCNTLKRSGNSELNRLDIIPTNIPFLNPLNKLNYILGYDINYKNGIKKNNNRFWYDPINYTKSLVNDIIKKYNDINIKYNILQKKYNDLEIKYNNIQTKFNEK